MKLVCLTDSNTAVSWYFQASSFSTRTAVSSNSITDISSEGISILPTSISSQGFYSCNISNNGVSEIYIAGIIDSTKTISKFIQVNCAVRSQLLLIFTTLALQSKMSYIYTTSVDSADTWVLCDPENSTRNLSLVHISNGDGFSFGNLLNINNFRGYFNSSQSTINCFYIDKLDVLLSVDLYAQG